MSKNANTTRPYLPPQPVAIPTTPEPQPAGTRPAGQPNSPATPIVPTANLAACTPKLLSDRAAVVTTLAGDLSTNALLDTVQLQINEYAVNYQGLTCRALVTVGASDTVAIDANQDVAQWNAKIVSARAAITTHVISAADAVVISTLTQGLILTPVDAERYNSVITDGAQSPIQDGKAMTSGDIDPLRDFCYTWHQDGDVFVQHPEASPETFFMDKSTLPVLTLSNDLNIRVVCRKPMDDTATWTMGELNQILSGIETAAPNADTQ